MKWNKYIISILLSLIVGNAVADNTCAEQSKECCMDNHKQCEYRHRSFIIPTHIVVQNAGNMGVLSAGAGWDYGKHKQWETDLLFGYIPKYQSTRGKLTMTLKENYIPWSINLTTGGVSIEPLRCGLYVNAVFGHEFWASQPNRYPDKYYEFMSTKFRINLFLGQQISLNIPQKNRNLFAKSITFFYEISTCDLYVRTKFSDNSVPLKDILGLSLGIKLQIF